MLDAMDVDCLLYRDEHRELIGILTHYPQDYPPYQVAGNFNLWTRPDEQRRGIASLLVDDANDRWALDFDQQRYTPAGLAFIEAYLKAT